MKRKAIYTLPLLVALMTLAGYCNSALAAIQDIDIADYTALPPFIDLEGGAGGFPSFLLAMSRDNQVFFKAYSDYGDLNGDNIPETTYLPDFEYYGLFNPDLCYEYRPDAITLDNTEGGFIPKDFSERDSSGRYNHICDGTTWSGNFMNWATTTRLDVIQKVIYGGRRAIDTDAETYLIGAWTPPDNHSFVKYLSGQSVITGATPIRDSSGAVPEELTLCRTSMYYSSQLNTNWSHVVAGENSPPPMVRIAIGDFRQWDFQITPCFRGGSEAQREFDETFTFVGDLLGYDVTFTNPYEIDNRDVIGTARPSDFDYNPSGPSPALADLVDTSTMRQSAITSADTTARSSPAFFRRWGFSLAVKVCDSSLQNAANKEACREYPNGNLKPSGMLQRYGEPGLMRVGLMTTSYRAALHGGILFGRLANINRHGEQDTNGDVAAPEINQQTGIFNLATRAFTSTAYRALVYNNQGNPTGFSDGTSEAQAAMGDGRIISYLDSIRVVGRRLAIDTLVSSFGGANLLDYNFRINARYATGIAGNTGNTSTCGFTGTRIVESCMNWGNPYAELISEAVRYLAGSETPTPSYLNGNWSATELGNILNFIFNPSRADVPREEVGFLWGHDNTLAWSDNADLLDVDLDCSPMNILAINSSVTSEDADDLQSDQAISGTSSTTWGEGVIRQATSRIGQLEDLHGKSFILPASNAVADVNVCSYRQLDDLVDVRGLCPNAPALQGSYYSAGAAFLAHTTDLRTDLDGEQTINFLGIEMRPNVPQINIPLSPGGSDSILLQPGYARRGLLGANIARVNNGTAVGYNNGRLTQFQPVYEPRWTIPNCRYEGVYIIGWEDALSGTDFDVDIIGYIDFKVHIPGAGCPFQGSTTMVEVGSQMSTGGSGSFQNFMGFTIAGTTQDGFHAFAGAYSREIRAEIANSAYDADALSYPVPGNDTPTNFAPNQPPSCDATVSHWDPTAPNPGSAPPVTVDLRRVAGTDARDTVSGCDHHSLRVSHLFVPSGSSSPSIIRPPLFYAAKYGGFKDSNNNKLPDLESEWDALDNRTGLAGADGEPDNYFLVTDPTILDGALERALIQGGISQRTASGTAAALVANEREGLGAVFQALFEPSFEDDNNRVATWFGTLHALFIDSRGLLREDSNGNARLDNYLLDKVVEVEFNESEGDTEARIFNSSDATSFVPAGSTVKAVSALGTIWNARKWLDQASVGAQRTYSASAAGAGDRRFIQTWLDGNANGRMEQTELVDFHQSTASLASNVGGINHFDVATADEAEDIIKFIRGNTRTTTFNRAANTVRNREIAYDDNTGREKMRLGDIVNSSPAAVTAPSESYDLLAGISSYRDFRQRWAGRRQMVYVGSNGGMLHAFNAGFYDASSRTVMTAGGNGENAHALGKEMWAYVPRVLLPHLKWQLEPNYPHSYYVDGSPRVFDAQVYNNDSTRQDGWGTFLVVGMRLGGGTERRHITIDSGNDGIGPANTDNDPEDDVAALSSYVVMDITNPEEAPRILAELAPPGLNYSTSRPAVVPVGGTWYLVFGSGPDTLATAEKSGNQNRAQLFFYDLNKIANGFTAYNDPPEVVIDLPNTEGQFVGGISVADFDLDVNAEAIYVTTAGNNSKGLVARVVMNESAAHGSWNTHVLLDSSQPIVSEPTLAVDEDGNRWVYVGSGRLFVAGDNSDSSVQTLYGFIEPSLSSSTTVSANSLYDVSTVRVFTNGGVDVDGGEPDTNYNAFRADVTAAGGWKRNYHAPGGTSPSQRTTNPSTLLGEVLFNTAYTPPGVNSTAAGCGSASLGESVLIGVDFRTGVSHPFGVLGTDNCSLSVCTDGSVEEALSERKLGRGLSSLPSLHLGSPNESLPGQVTVVVQQSTGEVESVQASTVGAGGSTNIDWREYAF